MASRCRFPPPSVEETDACVIIRDHNAHLIDRRSAVHLLTRDDAPASPPTSPKLVELFLATGCVRSRFYYL